MSRVKQGLNKTSQQRVKRLSKQILNDYSEVILNPELFMESFESFLTNEVRAQRTCSEKMVTDFVFETLYKELQKANNKIEEYVNLISDIKTKTRLKLARHYTNKTFDNNIDIYFNDVKREYIMCPQSESNDLEFTEENYDVFIKNNLKLVISTAKQYQNNGLPFEDLIQIGNMGLLAAIKKFNPKKSNLKDQIKSLVESSGLDTFTYNEAVAIIRKGFSYDDNLEKTLKKLPDEGFTSQAEFIKWINKNVKEAVFASVAFMWIRAYILNELNTNGKIIRVPKSTSKKKDEDMLDNLTPEERQEIEQITSSLTIINLDSVNPYTNDCYHDDELAEVTHENFIIEDEALENNERKETFKTLVNDALYKLNAVDRRIIKKRFGIDMPYELSISEIAESEGMSSNKVKYSIAKSLETISNSFSALDKETILSLL